MGEAVKWVRKANSTEILMEEFEKSKVFNVIHQISYCSKRPVQPKEVKEALHHLYRKTPNLRVCMGYRDGEAWFREVEEEIDFEVSQEDVDDVIEFLLTHALPRDSLLWRARFLTVENPSYHPPHLSSFHEDLRDTFPHCYHILFGFGHTIGDGFTFNRICIAFVHILDRVLAGEQVDGEQIGSFDLNDDHESKVLTSVDKVAKDETWRKQTLEEVYKDRPEPPLYSQLLSSFKGEVKKKTVMYTQIFDEVTTTRLVEKCRKAGVTVSSCVAAAGNLSLVDLLRREGVLQDTYMIANGHLINLRRTWSNKATGEKDVFGNYGFPSIPFFVATSPVEQESDEFWQYAKKVHNIFYEFLNDDHILDKIALNWWTMEFNHGNSMRPDLMYNTNGDLTQRFQGTKEITVTHYRTGAAFHNNPHSHWDYMTGTVRGRLSHTTKYTTALVSEDMAVQYSNLVYQRLLRVATK